MATEVFVDTSGFYALLAKNDDGHEAANRILRDASRRKRLFVTTDHVLDETATLVKARGKGHLLNAFFDNLRESSACRIEWTDADRFHDAEAFFRKHADQEWSFTDCISFRIMKELRLRDALTKDQHFREAGFVALLT
jgi:uncharacterized protein